MDPQDNGKDFRPGTAMNHQTSTQPMDTEYLNSDSAEIDLRQIQTNATGSVTISSELFERLYLQPKVADPAGLKHPLQKLFGNPTPLAIIGFEISLMSITMQLMEWGGAGGSRATNNANVIFFGGVLMWIGGLLEFILGQQLLSFPGIHLLCFYAAYGGTLMPEFNSYAPFSNDPVGDPEAGVADAVWQSNYAMYWVAITILMVFYWLCSMRTNVVYFLIFPTILPAVACIAAFFFHVSNARTSTAHGCKIKAAGSLLFASCMFGWYLLAALIFPTVDFPVYVPLGDLTGVVPGLAQLKSGGGRRPRLKKPKFGREKKHENGEQV